MNTVHNLDFATASLDDACQPDDGCPAMWRVLVCRIHTAERRQRIADDWERFAFGIASRRRPRALRRH